MLSRPLRCQGMAIGEISPCLHWSRKSRRTSPSYGGQLRSCTVFVMTPPDEHTSVQ